MMLRFVALVCFVLFCSVGQLRADDPAPTLDTVIAKYRADVLLDSGSSTEASPLFMTLAERRLAFAHFDALYSASVRKDPKCHTSESAHRSRC